ncbi:MAG: alkaline phosphatase D family protein [Flammeovirgaceae bacterium]
MRSLLGWLLLLLGVLACTPQQADHQTQARTAVVSSHSITTKQIQRIAFGSCAHQDEPQPILALVVAQKPDLFIYLGDNIYGDTDDMEVLRQKYQVLGQKSEFIQLKNTTPLLAIWDDHDYGRNDAGKEYPHKAASKEVFLDFWEVPQTSPRRKHAGIYHAHYFEYESRVVQIILLDTRTFRDALSKNYISVNCKNDYCPNDDPHLTMLGEAQWRWLEQELGKAADLRIIASSNQFAHEYNGWESWTNLPSERQRMVNLIQKTKANGVIFISGDVHWGELSKLETGNYPIHEVTSSGLTQTWDTSEPNKNRIGEVIMENNFGLIEIDWGNTNPAVYLKLIDINANVRVEQKVLLNELRP